MSRKTNKKVAISVVIIGLNEEKLVSCCMKALKKQKFNKPFEVIFVDNNSDDRTREIVNSFSQELNLKVLTEKERGIGHARQKGFKKAKAKIIASSDADSEVPSNWLNLIYEELSKGESIAVVGPYTFVSSSKLGKEIVKNLVFLADKTARLFSGFYNLRGLNFAIKKEVWQKAGGFNVKLNALEDVDLAYKISRMGNISYLNNLVVSTSNRRFKKDVLKSNVYRIKAFFYRVYLRDDTKYTEWRQIRD